MAVAAEQVRDGLLGEPEPVVHTEPVGRRSLRVVEVELLGNPVEQRAQAVSQVGSGLDDALVVRVERIS